ncbi:MAG TPA: methyltransferase domain-containing protein [Acidimicrobiia bacterium]|nr:methyltransferase domain-containing protein [Acidimicrobiia bacterium]
MRGWQSYDAVAGAYDRSWHPTFEPVARDLVGMVAVAPDDAVLDVGTGTGVAAGAASTTVQPGVLVGVDPSVPMLQIARARAPLAAVAARSPGLPFPARAFDVVLANLVVSHFPRYDDALADIVRVLTPGGRLGATAWGTIDDAPVDDTDQRELTRVWKSTAAQFVDLDAGAEVVESAIPGEAWFADPARLRAALLGSGVRDIEVHGRVYRRPLSLKDALAGFETSFWGRYLRHTLGDAAWSEFRADLAAAVAGALPDPITRVDQLLIGVGTKAYDTRP